jgi:molybdenum cofactor synthesis domain-containing protein
MSLAPLADVQLLVVDSCTRLPAIELPLAASNGHVLSGAVDAPEDIPPFANSAMDGFAVRAADTHRARMPAAGAGGTAGTKAADADDGSQLRLKVVETIAAGHSSARAIGPGEAARIMTGAPVPEGADAIVIVEDTEVTELRRYSADAESTESWVLFRVPAVLGNHIRVRGSDIGRGDRVFEAGEVLTPARLGTLSSLGLTAARVWRRPTVGVVSTGDELVASPAALQPGQIRDSNRVALMACLARDGFCPLDLGIVRDEESAVAAVLEGAIATCDAVVTSGGVSVGDYDYVKLVLDRLAGAGGGWMKSIAVAIRPAKPLAFGIVPVAAGRVVPVFGLPGNPVSSLVSYELFARPGLRKMAGHRDPCRLPVRAVAREPFVRQPDGKLHLLRTVAAYGDHGRLEVRSAGGQASHQLAGMAAANSLALIPDGTGIKDGHELDLLLLEQP